jgi:hypothetical protein
MPREDRRILFDNDEVYKAIFALSTQKQLKKPPPGHIVRVYQDEQDPSKIYLDLENPQDTSVNRTLDYNSDFLAAALMLFCRGCGIPLPKTAKKSVAIQDNTVLLRVQIG